MAGEQRKTVIVRKEQGARNSKSTSAKLSNMPLSVLLPAVGDIKDVLIFSEDFASRLSNLQEQNLSGNDSSTDAEERRARVLEESMLNQVVQWISIQSNRG